MGNPMDQPPSVEPKMIGPLSVAQAEGLVVLKIEFYGKMARVCREMGELQEAATWEAELAQLREFRWSIRTEDVVWLALMPHRHPELANGVNYLVNIRDGRIVAKYRLEPA